MGNATSHSAAGVGGGILGASLLAILVAHFHMDPALASAWISVVAGVLIAPVLAYLGVRSKTDPALAAALAALNASSSGDPPTVQATPSQTVVTNPPPAPPAVPPASAVVAPLTGLAADPSIGAAMMPHGAIDAPAS